MMTGVWQAGGRMSRTLTLHLDTLMLICQRHLDTLMLICQRHLDIGYTDTFCLQRQLDTGLGDTYFPQTPGYWIGGYLLFVKGTWILYRLILICQKHAAHLLYINFD